MLKFFNFFIPILLLFWCFTLSAQQNPQWTDEDPTGGTINQFIDAPGDSLGYIDVDALTGEVANLGCEYAFGYLWITARGQTNPVNQLWKIDISSTPTLVDSFPQGTTSLWGWRDLCSDGIFLYASDSDTIVQIDPTNGLPTGVSIPSPVNPGRALAYDPVTDHFWTASFTSDLYEIDRTGTIINQFPSPTSMYGLGWDGFSAGGPWLWANGGSGSQAVQIDPVTGLATGLVYTISAGGSDGGIDIDADLVPGLIVAVALVQETPDAVYIYEIDVPVPVELTSFTVTSNGINVSLNWSTATETNNQGFEVERSSNGSEFVKVGYVAGHGTVTETQNYNYTDQVSTGTYSYRLKQVDFDGSFEYSDAVEVEVETPAEFSLNQNYPNPFNPSTIIEFNLAVDSKVSLTVFDVLGQEVGTLINGNLAAGSREFTFDASALNSGVYFYRIDATGIDGTNFSSIKKMILTK